MPDPLAPSVLAGLRLANRFVRSATFEGLADPEGRVTPALGAKMAELARGEVGLIISGHAFVSREGRAGPLQMGAYSEDLRPGLELMVKAVHEAGGKIALQLAHAGARGKSELSGLEAVGPSVLEMEGKPVCRAATEADIEGFVEAFARAAKLGQNAGFDAVQVHSAHGYMLSQFLSPYFNHREDAYGGSLVNRARLGVRIVEAVRRAVGANYPLLLKINSEDFLPGGLSREDSLAAAKLMVAAGVDAVELSGGVTGFPGGVMPARPGKLKTRAEEGYYREAAKLFKDTLAVPLLLVGGVRSLETAQELLELGLADFISMSRPLICEPDLIKRWKAGDLAKSQCVSDNACYGPAFDGRGVFCVTFAKKRAKITAG